MTLMVETLINGRWCLALPEHRARRPEWATGWERERLDSMHAMLGPGDVVMDVGAEEGDLPALWASWGAQVVAVEPNPAVWPNIRAIFEENDLGAKMAGWFVGFASDVTVLDPPNLDVDATSVDGWPACAYGPVIGDHGFRHLAEEADATPQITLDELLARFIEDTGPATALSIDVEGAELAVLRGAVGILAEHRPLVWVSIHHEFMAELYGACFADIAELMDSHGYGGCLLGSDHEEHWLFVPRPG